MRIEGIPPQQSEPNRSLPEQKPAKEAAPTSSPPEPAVEVCIASTDKVDGEIEGLKAKAAQLSQQLAGADPFRQDELAKQLAQVEDELRQKDNDTYRRQHAVFSSGVDLKV